MGLSVTAYSDMHPSHVAREIAGQHASTYWIARVPSHGSAYADGIVDGSIWTFEEHDTFNPGSWQAFQAWREALACITGYSGKNHANLYGHVAAQASARNVQANETAGPFFALLTLSGCEGVYGSKTSAKLARDFITWEGVVVQAVDNSRDDLKSDEFLECYTVFQRMFTLASHNGAVQFADERI